MTVTLLSILSEVLKSEGEALDGAKKDLKTLRNNRAGIKASRKLIATELRVLKNKRLVADRNGGGAKSAAISAEINFFRQVLNDMTEEGMMVRIQCTQCAAYIKQQTAKVQAVDAEVEKAKAAEPVSETTEQA